MYQNNNKSSLQVIFSAFFLLFYLVVPNVASANHTGLHSLGQAISNAVTSVVNAISNAISGGSEGGSTNNTSNTGSGPNNSSTIIQRESGISNRDAASVLGDVLVNNLSNRGGTYEYRVRSTIGGTYEVTVYQVGSSGGGGGGGNPQVCTPPNLVVEDIYFVRPGSGNGGAVNQNELELGLSYVPVVSIRNRGCESTATPGKFINQMPFGQNGGFPNRLRVDFRNNNGPSGFSLFGLSSRDIDINSYLNNQSALAGGATRALRFPAIAMTTLGRHGIDGTVDVVGIAISCNGNAGCVTESGLPESNKVTENFRVIRPSISLGSFLMPNANTISGANQSAVRTIPVGAQVGLYWTGNLVNFASCTGTTTASNGAVVNDFTGQKNTGSGNGFAALALQLPTTIDNTDLVINEPAPAGVSHTYTISCRTRSGATVTDSVQIVAQAGQGCWMDNVANVPASCSTICAVAGGVPAADSNGGRCMSGESRQSGGILALGNGMPDPFQWGCMGRCVPQGLIPTTQVGNYCYRAGIPQDSNLSDLSVGCYCRVGATSTIANNRCTATPVVTVVPTECSDAAHNDIDQDSLIDALDPGCWTDPTASSTYDSLDNSERTVVTLVPAVSNLTLKTGERLTSVPFTTRNTGVMPVTEYKYIVTIGGQSRPEVTRQAALGAAQTDTPPSTVSYTAPGTAGTVPVRVCVSHPDMATAACDTANITIEAYQCNDGRDNDRDGRIDNRSNLEDPGCYTNPYVLTNANYDPTDDDESNGTIVVPQPTELSISGNPQVVRYDTIADLTYRINSTIPLNCTLAGPGVATTIISYSGSAVGTLVSRTVPSTTLKSAQSFTINCRPPVIPGVTTPAFTRTTLVEVIPKVQEI